ncbi:MAG: two-component regulator propeller domain-containing protein, partial [Pseudomonadota bacterium]
MRDRLRTLASLAALILLSSASIARDDGAWRQTTLSIEDGLPDTSVFSIARDSAGFLWFGTARGVVRFYGHGLQILDADPARPDRLTIDNAGNLFVDTNDRLWIGTFGGGVNRIDLQSGTVVALRAGAGVSSGLSSDFVQCFLETDDGTIWIGTAEGLDRHGEQGLTPAPDLAGLRIWDLARTLDGGIVAATSEGLRFLDENGSVTRSVTLPPDRGTAQIRAVFPAPDGGLWLGSRAGVDYLAPDGRLTAVATRDGSRLIVNRFRTEAGALLVATTTGVHAVDLAARRFQASWGTAGLPLLPGRDIRDIHADETGLLWIATRYGGVERLDPDGEQFSQQTPTPAVGASDHRRIWALAPAAADRLWVGTARGLLRRENDRWEGTTTTTGAAVPGAVRALEIDGKGDLWIGGERGLYRVRAGTREAEAVPAPLDIAGVRSTGIFAIEAQADGRLWLGLLHDGVIAWDPAGDAVTHYAGMPDGQQIGDFNVTCLHHDGTGTVWICTNFGGLLELDPTTGDIVAHRPIAGDATTISAARVNQVIADRSGRLWIATERGLDRYAPETGTFERWGDRLGLDGQGVQAVIEAPTGDLWLATRTGLLQVNVGDGSASRFGPADGLPAFGFHARAAAWTDPETLAFGGSAGLTAFAPGNVRANRTVPRMAITRIFVDREEQRGGWLPSLEPLTLGTGNRSIAFEFAALDFHAPAQNRYRYRLVGQDDRWYPAAPGERIRFERLPAGDYRFEVLGSNQHGVWAWQPAVADISIEEAWWRLPWIPLVVGALLALLAIATAAMRGRNLRIDNARLRGRLAAIEGDLAGTRSQLEECSTRDPATGLLLRAVFREHAAAALAASAAPTTLVLVDVDDFERVNDRLGRDGGDQLLTRIAQQFSTTVDDELAARWAGKEFVGLCSGRPGQQVLAAMERLCAAVAEDVFRYRDEQINVSVTVGVAEARPGESLSDVLGR